MIVNQSLDSGLSQSSPLICDFCKKESLSPLPKCSLCKKVNYCTRQCQTNDWITHKHVCQELRRTPGEKMLKEGRYTEAIYLLSQETAERLVDGNRLELIEKSKCEFKKTMNESLKPNTVTRNARALYLLNMFHRQMGWSPLAHLESPGMITDFLGEGETIVTPIVQTLPELLSSRFSKVFAVDLSIQQILFSQNLSKALETASLDTFQTETLDLLKNICSKQWDNSIADQLMDEMKTQFLPLMELEFKNNVFYYNKDLFIYVEQHKEKRGKYPDVVFLSTIPIWDLENWPNRYGIIRTWIQEGVTVVFSLFDYGEQNGLQFIDCFRDIASVEQTMDELNGTSYIKLVKRPNN